MGLARPDLGKGEGELEQRGRLAPIPGPAVRRYDW
jgi:hypothetical protein